MEMETLKRLQNKCVKIMTKGSFIYTDIRFRINSEGLIEFEDRNGELVLLEPNFVSMITIREEVNNG